MPEEDGAQALEHTRHTMKRAVGRRRSLLDLYWSYGLRSIDILGLQALGATLHLELHLRAFFQRSIAIHLDCCEVNKNIIAVRALDEAIALCGVKPFHDTFFSHYSILLTSGAVLRPRKTTPISRREITLDDLPGDPTVAERTVFKTESYYYKFGRLPQEKSMSGFIRLGGEVL